MTRIEELTLALLDGNLEPEEEEELERLVDEDEEARAIHLSLLEQEAVIRGERRDLDLSAPVVERVRNTRGWTDHPVVRLALAAGILLALASGALLVHHVRSRKPETREAVLFARETVTPGIPTTVRTLIRDGESERPLPGARVELALVPAEGGAPVWEHATTSDEQGLVVVALDLPGDSAQGPHSLRMDVAHEGWTEHLERSVAVERSFRVLVSTDKPLYQPGQVVHLHALALAAVDGSPAAGREVLFEVADARGNKVFEGRQAASEFGIAAVDFELADQVNLGDYAISVTVDETVSERVVRVERYVLPRFAVELTTDRTFRRPGETARAHVRARYTFGEPVVRGLVRVEASEFVEDFRPFAVFEGVTDEDGGLSFDVELPSALVGMPSKGGDALVSLEAVVTDGAGHEQRATTDLTVSHHGVRVDLIVEGGRLVRGIPNTVYVLTSYPDGTPAPATVTLEGLEEPVETDTTGFARVTYTPEVDAGLWRPHLEREHDYLMYEAYGRGSWRDDLDLAVTWPHRTEDERAPLVRALDTEEPAGGRVPVVTPYYLTATVDDRQGNIDVHRVRLDMGWRDGNLVLAPDRSVYAAGDPVHLVLLSNAPAGRVFLDLVRSGVVVRSATLDLDQGRADLALDLPPDLFGTVELVAYRVLDDGEIASCTRVIQVRRADGLEVAVTADRARYRPGDVAHLAFRVRGVAGDPQQAALWLAGVDEAVFALREMRPGLERVFFEVQRELLEPRYEIHGRGQPDPARLLHPEADGDAVGQRGVRAMMAAAAGSGGPPVVRGETYEERAEALRRQRAGLLEDAALIPAFLPLPLATLTVLGALALMIAGLRRRESASAPGDTFRREALGSCLRLATYWSIGISLPFLLQFRNYGGHGLVLLVVCGAAAVTWLVLVGRSMARTRGFMDRHGDKLAVIVPSWLVAGGQIASAETHWGGWFDGDTPGFLLGHVVSSAVSLWLFGFFVGSRAEPGEKVHRVRRAFIRWWLPMFWIPYALASLLFVAEVSHRAALLAGFAAYLVAAIGIVVARARPAGAPRHDPRRPLFLAPSIALFAPMVGWVYVHGAWQLNWRGLDFERQALFLGGVAAVALSLHAAFLLGRARRPGSVGLRRAAAVSVWIAVLAATLLSLRSLHWHMAQGLVALGAAAAAVFLVHREVRWLSGLPPVGTRPTLVTGLRLLPAALALVFLGTLAMGGDGGLALVHLLNWTGMSLDPTAYLPRMVYGDTVIATGELFDVVLPTLIALFVACAAVAGLLAYLGTRVGRWARTPTRLVTGLTLAALLATPWFFLRSLPVPGPATSAVGAASAEQKEALVYSGLGLSKPDDSIRTAGRDRPPVPDGAGEELKPPTRVRRHFPETLLWTPQLVTDEDGRAELDVPLADSITTWRLAVGAVSHVGHLGSTSEGLVAHQDFFVDLDLPVALTRGDETTVPVALYSYLDRPQAVRLELEPAPWFEVIGATTHGTRLGPRESGRVDYRIRALEPGDHVLTVRARGSELADAVERRVRVLPDGEQEVRTVNGRLTGPTRHTLEFPEGAVAGGNDLQLLIYPGTFSQVVEGIDGIFRMPYGCFEQTSSVTYPNLLALDYLRRTGQSRPEVEARALSLIHTGYQRLLSFEVAGGGFEWFGHSPAHTVLTAYGLMEFSDMAKVIPVDDAVILRTREWLYRQQIEDGAWVVNGRDHGGAIGQLDEDRLLTTAYVAWALAETGERDARLTRALDLLAAQLDAVDDPYTLALCAAAFAAADHGSAGDALARLAEHVQRDGEGAWWSSAATGATYGRGRALEVETTAIVAHTYLRAGHDLPTAHRALTWLIEQRGPGGTWGSTQATVQAMRALLLGATEAEGLTEEAVIRVAVDGAPAAELTITPDQADVHHRVDLGRFATSGAHEVTLETAATGGLAYQVVATHHMPWGDRPREAVDEPMTLAVVYDASRIAVGDELTCAVTVAYRRPGAAQMTLVDLGVPPGFDVLTADLDLLVAWGRIERYELSGSQLTVYLRSVTQDRPVEFQYRLRARYPVRAQTPPSQAYPYYEPDVRADAPPVELQAI